MTTTAFGRALCAMITPFTETGALDLDGAQRLAAHLISEGCDGLVLSGTTGESPTTTDAEKSALVRAVREAVGPTTPILTGVGTADTHHTAQLTLDAAKSGATGILLAPPYYSRPPQAAVESHLREIADLSELPVMLYDIPSRTATRLEPSTLLRLADHPRIVAVKDCSYDFLAAQKLISRTDLAYYAGCDEHNLALYAVGGTGYVSTISNAAARQVRTVLDLFDAGDTSAAAKAQQRLIPLTESMMSSDLPGTVTAKALLSALGLPSGPVRRPLLNADPETTKALRAAYEECG
ncbi:4-hydroxy-tetrahydrodipicolinate synthase [Streptomyces niveiscabiei]|uniref:4-hydroxy-tetrahydrodipicolinate synthase n=1 Tax=Streptomyces niveiscabiei TaxID=164115 RepID=UPI0029B0543A|nr:4-hydroxy-tetrahydrodipicolinate synthase [Streptomyces niveiscabiei]MDX3385062.1 4-hydroxy-tetrahydrodipicolinate synthase [Streptomyces niveiscabiei]